MRAYRNRKDIFGCSPKGAQFHLNTSIENFVAVSIFIVFLAHQSEIIERSFHFPIYLRIRDWIHQVCAVRTQSAHLNTMSRKEHARGSVCIFGIMIRCGPPTSHRFARSRTSRMKRWSRTRSRSQNMDPNVDAQSNLWPFEFEMPLAIRKQMLLSQSWELHTINQNALAALGMRWQKMTAQICRVIFNLYTSTEMII